METSWWELPIFLSLYKSIFSQITLVHKILTDTSFCIKPSCQWCIDIRPGWGLSLLITQSGGVWWVMSTVSPQPLIGGEPLSSPVVGGGLLSLSYFRRCCCLTSAGRQGDLMSSSCFLTSQWVERGEREEREERERREPSGSPGTGTDGEQGPGRGPALYQGGERRGERGRSWPDPAASSISVPTLPVSGPSLPTTSTFLHRLHSEGRLRPTEPLPLLWAGPGPPAPSWHWPGWCRLSARDGARSTWSAVASLGVLHQILGQTVLGWVV